jgi:hypothetical protein
MPPIPAAPAVPREGEPPPQPRTRKMDPTVRTRPVEVGSRSPVRAILFIGGVVVVLILVAGFVVRSVRARRAATSAKQAAAAASESVPETAAIAPATAAPVVIDAGVVAFVDGPDAAPDLRPFDKQVARAALDAASAKLADCRVPKGKPVKVKVTFTPQGSVSAASPLAPHGAQKACVAGHLKEVRIASFQGSAHTAVYALTVPKNP